MAAVRCCGFASFSSNLSRLRDGGVAGAEAENGWILTGYGDLEIHSRAIVGSAKVGWLVDLPRDHYLNPGFLEWHLDSWLRWVNAIQASLNDWLEGGGRRLLYSAWKALGWGCLYFDPPEEPSEASIPPYAVVVSAVVLLSIVYQYLTGNVDTGSSKAYSRSSLDFRDVYVAVVLFLGAYVWIKFREVAFKGVYERKIVDKHGRLTKVVYEPRFKPPRENGTVFEWIYLGQYATPEEAAVLYQIAAFYYNEGQGGSLDLEDGRWFSIPPMREGEQIGNGAVKREWVKKQARKVYEDFKKEKQDATLLVRESLEACEDQVMPNQAVGPSEASLLNLAEYQLPLLESPGENSGMPIAMLPMLDNQGLDCTSQSFGGVHEGFVTSSGPSLVFQEESGIPIPQLPPNAQSGMGINNNDQLNLHPIVHNQQELITYQRQQIEERDAQISFLQNQILLLQQQLDESRIRIPQLESQHFGDQFIIGVPSDEEEMEQSMSHGWNF